MTSLSHPSSSKRDFVYKDLNKVVSASALGLLLLAGVVVTTPASAQDNLPDGPGKNEVVAACSGCHGIGQIIGEHRTADKWSDTVNLMISNGAPVADADFDKVVGYLTANFGPDSATAAPVPGPGASPPSPAAPAPQ